MYKGIFPCNIFLRIDLHMTFTLPDEWRIEIKKNGTPLYLDADNGERYVLLEIMVESNETGGYRAHPNTLAIYGNGKTKRKAIDDLHKKFNKLTQSLPSQKE
jgi:hypothetical protein